MKPTMNLIKVDGTAEISLSGELTFRYVKELKRIFEDLDGIQEPARISFATPQGIDLVFLQMWWRFLKTSEARGLKIQTSFTLPESEEQLIRRLNLINLLQ